MAIRNGNIGPCVNLIKGHKFLCLGHPLTLCMCSVSNLILSLHPAQQSHHYSGPAPPVPRSSVGPRKVPGGKSPNWAPSSDFLPCWSRSAADHILSHCSCVLPPQTHHPGLLRPQNLLLTPIWVFCLSVSSHDRVSVLVFCPKLLLEPCLSACKRSVLSFSGSPSPRFPTGDVLTECCRAGGGRAPGDP